MTTRLRVFLSRVAGLFGRRQKDRDLDEEIQGHLDLLTDDYVRRGLSKDAAAAAARRALGRIEPVKEIYRDQRGLPIVDTLRQDLRFAIRLLGRQRAFTLATAGTLAIGIGVHTSFFTIVNAICIRGLPIERPRDVLSIRAVSPRGQLTGVSFADFEDLRRSTAQFAGVAAYADTAVSVADEGRAADRVTATYISAGAFRLLGRPPALGREFTPADDTPGAVAVALLSEALWQSRYRADPGVIGRTITVNGDAVSVVGILPQRFRFPVNSDLWLPLAARPALAESPRDRRDLSVAGRLGENADLHHARTEIEALGRRLSESFPATNRDVRLTATPINEVMNGRITDTVWLAFITAGVIVLLVSCANVANLYLMRSTARTREMAIRTSIGASRRRLIGQLLVECTLLSGLGSGLGLALSVLATRLLALSVPAASPLPFWIDFAPDWRVLGVVIATAVATVFVCGLVPAVQASNVKLPRALRLGAQLGTPTARTRWLTSGFLAVELGLAFVLVMNVAMAMEDVWDWERRRIIDPAPLLTAAITLPNESYRTASERSAFYANLEERLRTLPGVRAATIASRLPLLGGVARELAIEGRDEAPGTKPATVSLIVTGDHYFDAVGIAALSGRLFIDRDGLPGNENVLVNQRFVDVHLSGSTAIGQRLQLSEPGTNTSASWQTIVGVVPTIREWSSDEGSPVVYEPTRANPPGTGAIIVRVGHGDPSSVATLVRDAVRRLDDNLPIYRVSSFEQALRDSNWNGRVSAQIILTISALAMFLALVGQFVVTAQGVSQRTQEIGLRIAVGAGSTRVVRLVLRRALVQVVGGLAFGVILLFLLGSVFPVPDSLHDARVVAIVVALVVAVAMVACLAPALRAARVDPVKALRTE